MTWKILCLKLDDGKVSPMAKTKREISKKEAKKLLGKFRKDEDVVGEILMNASRLSMTELEIRRLPLV